MRRANTDFYYVRDDQYNVVRIADASGNIVESYDYDDFGRPINPTTRQPITSSAVSNPFFFTGRVYDWQTGLYNYRTRYYDPIAGRFTSRDRIGMWGDRVNLGNGFAYVGNNPWARRDPRGRCTLKDPDDPSAPGPQPPSPPGPTWGDWADKLNHDAWGLIYTDDDLSNMSDTEVVVIPVTISIVVGVGVGVGMEVGVGELISIALGTGNGDEDTSPKPPGWDDSWRWEPPSGEAPGDPRWWDPDGGEWRYHPPDPHHGTGHWDYNPWDKWNSPWRNIPF